MVSVIIPTYNRAALLDRCLKSLVGSGVPDLEVIVVDDGGKDESGAVCQRYTGVTYVRQENAGVSAARNHGFRLSHGEYVAFIDSDDEWINGGMTRLLAQASENPDVGLVFADTLMGNPDEGFTSFIETYGGQDFLELPFSSRSGPLRVFERRPFLLQLSTRNVMFLGSMLFRRDLFETLGGFDEKLSGAADWDIFMRATTETKVGYSEGDAVSLYYKHDGGMSTNSEHMEHDFIKALDALRRRSRLDAVERAHVDHRIRAHVFGWAYEAYVQGDFKTMRKRLAYSWELGQAGLRERVYLCATYFPPTFVTAMRRARHAIGI
jgi:glycosyltransferase involved in cell wall biosynthesis